VNTCPEGAAELRHQFSIPGFFKIAKKYEIRKAELQQCEKCGAFFAPEPLMDKIGKTLTHEYLHFCPNCRKTNMGDYLQRLSPWHRKDSAVKKEPALASKRI